MEKKSLRKPGRKAAVRSIEEAYRGLGNRTERNLQRIEENIKTNGIYYNPFTLRNSIIGGLQIRNKRGAAENLVIIGCACFGTALPLRSYCLLLQKLGVDYVFLDKEYCCGAPLLHNAVLEGKELAPFEDKAREFIGLNISQAREQGVKNMLHFCPWCAYLSKRLHPDSEIKQMYGLDILSQYLEGADLVLEKRVAYFGGLSHRWAFYVPEQNFDLNWSSYRGLIDRVKGLQVVKIPKTYCCQIAPQAIFDHALKAGADTLVVDCVVCYGGLMRKAQRMAPGLKVKYITDILLAALEHDERVLTWV